MIAKITVDALMVLTWFTLYSLVLRKRRKEIEVIRNVIEHRARLLDATSALLDKRSMLLDQNFDSLQRAAVSWVEFAKQVQLDAQRIAEGQALLEKTFGNRTIGGGSN